MIPFLEKKKGVLVIRFLGCNKCFMFSEDIWYILPNFHSVFFDKYEIHIQVFVDLINGKIMLFRSSSPQNIRTNDALNSSTNRYMQLSTNRKLWFPYLQKRYFWKMIQGFSWCLLGVLVSLKIHNVGFWAWWRAHKPRNHEHWSLGPLKRWNRDFIIPIWSGKNQ